MSDENMEIVVAESGDIVRLGELSADQMAKSPEAASLYVRAAVETNNAFKLAKDRDTNVKNDVKRMFSGNMDREETVVIYDYDTESKLTLSPSKGGAVLDEDELLAKIYEHFGETPGDKTGQAWAAYCSISDPVAAPRKINPTKLAEEIKRSERIKLGQEGGMPGVTAKMVEAVTVIKKPVYSCSIGKMTKDEKARHSKGELVGHMVVK